MYPMFMDLRQYVHICNKLTQISKRLKTLGKYVHTYESWRIRCFGPWRRVELIGSSVSEEHGISNFIVEDPKMNNVDKFFTLYSWRWKTCIPPKPCLSFLGWSGNQSTITEATKWYIVPVPGGDVCGVIGGMIGKANRGFRRKPAPVPSVLPQNPHVFTRKRSRAVAVGSRGLAPELLQVATLDLNRQMPCVLIRVTIARNS
jgi:hypothetical protein